MNINYKSKAKYSPSDRAAYYKGNICPSLFFHFVCLFDVLSCVMCLLPLTYDLNGAFYNQRDGNMFYEVSEVTD